MQCRRSMKYRIVMLAKGKFLWSSKVDLSLLCLLTPLTAPLHPSSNLCYCYYFYYMDTDCDGRNVPATSKTMKTEVDAGKEEEGISALQHQTCHRKAWQMLVKCMRKVEDAKNLASIRGRLGSTDLWEQSWLIHSAWEILGRAELPKLLWKYRVSVHSSLATVICFIRSFAFNFPAAFSNSLVSLSAELGVKTIALWNSL